MLKVVKIGDWTRVGKLLSGAPQRVQAAIDKAMRKEGHFLRTNIVEGIREQAPGGRAFAPLAPTTLAIRRFRGFGGTKALIAGGDLRNSITVTREGDQVFVGVDEQPYRARELLRRSVLFREGIVRISTT